MKLSSKAKEELASYEKNSPDSVVIKIQRMMDYMKINPRKWGTGDPERLRHFKNQEIWFRREYKKPHGL